MTSEDKNTNSDDYTALRKFDVRLGTLADMLSEVAKASGNFYKIITPIGFVIGLLGVALYLRSEGAISAFIDTITSPTFLIAIAVLAAAITSGMIFIVTVPILSKVLILHSVKGYQPEYTLGVYLLHYSSVIVMVIAFPVAVGMDLNAVWLLPVLIVMIGSFLLTLRHANRHFRITLSTDNVAQMFTMHSIANLLSIGWILTGFISALKPLERLSVVTLEYVNARILPSITFLTPEILPPEKVENIISYIVFVGGLLIALLMQQAISFIPLRVRPISLFAFLILFILMFWIPGPQFFVEKGLRVIEAGGNIAVTFTSGEKNMDERHGCLILATPNHYVYREVDKDAPCLSNMRYNPMLSQAEPASSIDIRIISLDKYERKYREVKPADTKAD